VERAAPLEQLLCAPRGLSAPRGGRRARRRQAFLALSLSLSLAIAISISVSVSVSVSLSLSLSPCPTDPPRAAAPPAEPCSTTRPPSTTAITSASRTCAPRPALRPHSAPPAPPNPQAAGAAWQRTELRTKGVIAGAHAAANKGLTLPTTARGGAGERAVLRRCAILMTVRPRAARASASCTASSLSESSADVACAPRRDETCPISTEGWTRRVHFVREGGRGGRPARARAAPSALPRARRPPQAPCRRGNDSKRAAWRGGESNGAKGRARRRAESNGSKDRPRRAAARSGP